MELSVVFLSNIIDDVSSQLLTDAVDTLSSSISDIDYEIVIVESGNLIESKKIVGKRGVVLPYQGNNFNFHKALNQGFIGSNGDYICFSNNDVVFYPDWFKNIKRVLLNNNLKAASPIDPKDDKLWMFDKNNISFIEGYEIQKFFKGWCFVIEKNAMKRLRKFDERFDFYFADNDFILELLKYDIKHAVVLDAHVEHRNKPDDILITDLDKLKKINGELFKSIPKDIIKNKHWWKIQNLKMTRGLITFHKKWGLMSYLNIKIKLALFFSKNKIGFLNRIIFIAN